MVVYVLGICSYKKVKNLKKQTKNKQKNHF